MRSDLMDWHEVEAVGSMARVRADDVARPIMLDAERPAELGPGWRARGAYGGFAPFQLVDLEHDSGAAAFWLLDPALRIVGSDGIPAAIADAFDAALLHRLRSLVASFWQHADAPGDPAMHAFLRLSRALRRRLFERLPRDALAQPYPDVVDLFSTEAQSWPLPTRPGAAAAALSKPALLRVLQHDLQAAFLDACRQRRLAWPALSVIDAEVPAHGIFFRSDFAVLRCRDAATDRVFYVVLMGADLGAVAVAVPELNTVFAYFDRLPGHYRGALEREPGHLVFLFARHLLCGPAEFPGWLGGAPQSVASFTWPHPEAHLGHFLWNEASGLERALRSLEPVDYPAILNLAGGSNTEFYAPLETLYPEFADRVNNTLADLDAMQTFCYRHAVQPIRLSGHRVTAAIRDRVMAVVAADPHVRLMQDMGGPTLDPAMPVVVLGLRLSDRTHADLGGFYARLIARLLADTPDCGGTRLTVVIDGLNARPGGRGASPFAVLSGTARPADLLRREQALVERLRRAIAGWPVRLIDCVGVEMRINLFWIGRAQMFVAPWGAGLVKYRWVCNKPGLVFSSRTNLTQPDHLPIYHLPLFMDDPAPLDFVDPLHVTDLRRPDQPLDERGRDAQQQNGGLSGVNFEFDEPPVLDRVAALFATARPR